MKSEHYNDQNDAMKRIRIICPELWAEILELESKFYSELQEKVMDMTVVKDKILEYDITEARRLFDSFFKSDLTK